MARTRSHHSNWFFKLLTLVTPVLVAVGCGGGGGTDGIYSAAAKVNVPPPAFHYSSPSYTLPVGQTMTPISPIMDAGGPVKRHRGFSLTGALPAGIAFNADTGVFTGKPTTPSVKRDLTVVASGAGGKSEPVVLAIEVTGSGAAAPTVTAILPDTGSTNGNQSVTITGTGFVANQAGVNSVAFGPKQASFVVTQSDTTITCITPSGAVGAVDVAVTNANGTGVRASGFTYILASGPIYRDAHPRIYLERNQSRLAAALTGNTAASTRFKGMVDRWVAGEDIYDFQPWWSALLWQLTGETQFLRPSALEYRCGVDRPVLHLAGAETVHDVLCGDIDGDAEDERPGSGAFGETLDVPEARLQRALRHRRDHRCGHDSDL